MDQTAALEPSPNFTREVNNLDTILAERDKLKDGWCVKCNMGPLRESCAYPEACEHPGRALAVVLNRVLLERAKRN